MAESAVNDVVNGGAAITGGRLHGALKEGYYGKFQENGDLPDLHGCSECGFCMEQKSAWECGDRSKKMLFPRYEFISEYLP